MDIIKEKSIPIWVALIKNGRKTIEDIKDVEVMEQVKLLLSKEIL